MSTHALIPRRLASLVVAFLLAVAPAIAVGPAAYAAGAGTLDPTFGSEGKVTTDSGGLSLATSLALQDDGKLVAAGTVSI